MKNEKEPMEIPEEDMALFEAMKGNYVSENERVFFETMRYKEEYELAPSNDLIMSEKDNEDRLYICREYDCEYAIGAEKRGFTHTDSLADALATRLNKWNIIDDDYTLLEWLRKRDYDRVQYDHNYDLMTKKKK